MPEQILTPAQMADVDRTAIERGPFDGARLMQNAGRADLDLVSLDPHFGVLKVSPVLEWNDQQMEAYLTEHALPNEWDYHDPAKADERRECGLHAAWGRTAAGSNALAKS